MTTGALNTALASAGRRTSLYARRSTREKLLEFLIVVPVGCIAGYAIVTVGAILVLAAILIAAGLVVGLTHWRWSIWGVMLYLPVSGIPILVAYPHTGPAALIKDILFVVPGYLGCAWVSLKRRSLVLPPGAPLVMLGLLALLVVGDALNPDVPGHLVALIGIKVWLFYIPMLFVGYLFVRDRSDLSRLLKVMSLIALVPAVVGIVEAALIYGGHSSVVYRVYGSAAFAATQRFGQFDYVGGGALRRIPSTFSFVTQYSFFQLAMVAVAYAWWHGPRTGPRRPLAVVLWLVMATAFLLSGARSAFVLLPVLLALIFLLDRRSGNFRIGPVLVGAGVLVGVLAFLGIGGYALGHDTLRIAHKEFHSVVINGFKQAYASGLLGSGTGSSTLSARHYALADWRSLATFPSESLHVKALSELGFPGFVLVEALFIALVASCWRNHRRLVDPRLRAVSSALLALVITLLLLGVKGEPLDLDPTDVYFWFFLGVLYRLPALDSEPPPNAVRQSG